MTETDNPICGNLERVCLMDIRATKKDVGELKGLIEKHLIDSIDYKEDIKDLLHSQDNRITKLEQQNKLIIWIFGVVTTFIIGILLKYVFDF